VETGLDIVDGRIEEKDLFITEAGAVRPCTGHGALGSRKLLPLADAVAFGAAQEIVREIIGQPPINGFGPEMLYVSRVIMRKVALAVGTDAAVHGI
jgi:hypothetical protein